MAKNPKELLVGSSRRAGKDQTLQNRNDDTDTWCHCMSLTIGLRAVLG